jgi:hypothetical protein
LPPITDLKQFYRKKVIVAEEVSVHCYNFNPISQVKKGNPELEPEPKEIISAPQYFNTAYKYVLPRSRIYKTVTQPFHSLLNFSLRSVSIFLQTFLQFKKRKKFGHGLFKKIRTLVLWSHIGSNADPDPALTSMGIRIQ